MTKKTARQVLVDALALIEDEAHWTKHAFLSVNPAGEEAYCSVGALRKATFGDALAIPSRDSNVQVYYLAHAMLYAQVEAANAGRSVYDWNDMTYHGDVVAKFRAAIEHATDQERRLAAIDRDLVA